MVSFFFLLIYFDLILFLLDVQFESFDEYQHAIELQQRREQEREQEHATIVVSQHHYDGHHTPNTPINDIHINHRQQQQQQQQQQHHFVEQQRGMLAFNEQFQFAVPVAREQANGEQRAASTTSSTSSSVYTRSTTPTFARRTSSPTTVALTATPSTIARPSSYSGGGGGGGGDNVAGATHDSMNDHDVSLQTESVDDVSNSFLFFYFRCHTHTLLHAHV